MNVDLRLRNVLAANAAEEQQTILQRRLMIAGTKKGRSRELFDLALILIPLAPVRLGTVETLPNQS